jgi:hypothetical protein
MLKSTHRLESIKMGEENRKEETRGEEKRREITAIKAHRTGMSTIYQQQILHQKAQWNPTTTAEASKWSTLEPSINEQDENESEQKAEKPQIWIANNRAQTRMSSS